jgi:hypothetical protein
MTFKPQATDFDEVQVECTNFTIWIDRQKRDASTTRINFKLLNPVKINDEKPADSEDEGDSIDGNKGALVIKRSRHEKTQEYSTSAS